MTAKNHDGPASVYMHVCLSVCLSLRMCDGAGVDEKISTSVTTGGQVKSLGVPASKVDELSVSVTHVSGSRCSPASLTTLPNGQLGMMTTRFMTSIRATWKSPGI